VAGGYDATSPGALTRPVHDIQAFVKELGREIVDQGHTLLTGCRTDLDKLVAESAHARLNELGIAKQSPDRIISYVNQGTDRP
jgi:hypothetical protein